MKKVFKTLLYSWGSDTPEEVIWSLNDFIEYLKTKGFETDKEFAHVSDDNYDYDVEDKLINKISKFIDERL